MVLLVTLAFACAPRTVEEVITVNNGDWVVVAAADRATLHIEHLSIRPAEQPIAMTVRPEERVFIWTLGPNTFINPNGETIPIERLEITRLEDVSGLEPGCGRCLFPVARSPQPLFSGDQCPLLSGLSPVALDGSAIERESQHRLASQIIVTHPGTCACEVPETTTDRNALDFRVLGGRADPHPIAGAAQSADGTTAFFAGDFARVREPSGATIERQIPEAICADPQPRLRLIDATVEAVAPFGDDFLVVSKPGDQYTETGHIDRVDRDLRRTARMGTDDLNQLRALGAQVVDGLDGVIISGSVQRRGLDDVPALVSCTDGGGGGLQCSEVTAFPTNEQPHAILNVAQPGPGEIFGASRRGRIYRFDPSTRPWSHRISNVPAAIPPAPTSGSEAVAFRADHELFRAIAALPARLYACLHAARFQGATVITASVTSAAPRWSVIANLEGACGGFVPDPSDPARLWLYEVPNRVHVLSASGTITQSRQEIAAQWGVGGIIARMLPGRSGHVLAERRDGAWFEVDGTDTVQQLYGPRDSTEVETTAIVADERAFWAFAEGGIRYRVVGDDLTKDKLTGVPDTDIPVAAVRRGDETVLVGRGWRAGAIGWIRVVRDDGTSEEIADHADLGGAVPVDATVAGGRVVIVTDPDRVLLLDPNNHLQEVPIDWDDPLTDDVEARPAVVRDGSQCGPRNRRKTTTEEHGYFAAIDAWGPVAYVSGCFGVMLRVSLIPGFERAERVSLSRLPPAMEHPDRPYSEGAYSAVKTICPDTAWASTLIFNSSLNRPPIIAVGPSAQLGSFEPPITVAPDGRRLNLDRFFSTTRSVELIGDAPAYTLVGRTEALESTIAHRFAAGRLRRVPIEPLSAAQSSGGDVLIGSRQGRLILGRQCDFSDLQ